MEPRYIFWHTPAGCSLGCITVLVVLVGAVFLGVLDIGPLLGVAILAPTMGLLSYLSIRLDRKRTAGGADHRKQDPTDL